MIKYTRWGGNKITVLLLKKERKVLPILPVSVECVGSLQRSRERVPGKQHVSLQPHTLTLATSPWEGNQQKASINPQYRGL